MVKTVNVLVCQSAFWSTSPPSHHLLVRSWQWWHWCWVLTLSWRRHGIIHGRFPPAPLNFFCSPIETCPPNIILRNCPTKSNADFVSPYTLIPLFRKNWHDHRKLWRFHQICLPFFQGRGGGGVMLWVVPILEKPVHLFALQINGLVSIR